MIQFSYIYIMGAFRTGTNLSSDSGKPWNDKSEIMQKCPDISRITVQRTLSELVKSGDIIKIGGGRYTAYTWNRERE